MKNDGFHGRNGNVHCGNQMCCWGPVGKRDKLKKPKSAHPVEECIPACFDESKAFIVKPKRNKRYKVITDHIKLIEQVRNFVNISVKEGREKELILSRLIDAKHWLKEVKLRGNKNG